MYLIYGESFRLMEEEIKKIIGKNQNVITLDLSSSTINDVFMEASYVSLLEEEKFIVVKNVSFFSSSKGQEKEIELFLDYLNHPLTKTTVILTTYEKIDARKKITKLFKEKYKIISVDQLSNDDLINKIKDYVKKNKYKINLEVIQFIMRCCNNHFDLIYNELNKLFLYYNEPQEIRLEDVKQIISRPLIDNNFKFVEAVIDKNFKNALKILEDLYALKVDPIALILLLAREYRLMYSINVLMREGYRKNNISKELGLQEWQIDKILKNNAKYGQEDLREYMKRLAILDYEIKSGNADKFLGLKTFLLEIE